ncbi:MULTISPECIES: DUF1344 domain-containing protein [Phyllobacteriaceae]|jgi:Cu/Ag efflux protein CusF|nr:MULTISPECIES: DUF1344 domain-containing protein [Mesorhizobium]MBN9236946.1 DUF1344 domain-containing protein [Mesorhizobium sp.]MDQ0328212.1 Cu/Ag efflux protein CusF [Mesorhizobium sp. YL-MeA3-2017]
MRKYIAAAAVVFALAGVNGAMAKDLKATIKKVDAATSSITLDNGQSVTLPAGVKAASLKAGDKVLITYSTDAAGKATVQSIKPSK